MSQTIIGLDIGHYSIKALKLEVGYRTLEAVSFDEQPLEALPSREEIVERLRESLGGDDAEERLDEGEVLFTEQDIEDAIHNAEDDVVHGALFELQARGALDDETMVSVALPPDLVMGTRMRFPFTDRRQLAGVIPIQFEERIPVPVDELLIDHHVVGPSRSESAEPGMNDVTVAAVKLSDLAVYLDLWRVGGVDPHYVLMGDGAMLHLGAHLLSDAVEPVAIVDIGHKFTRVACIEPGEKGPVLGFARSLQLGGDHLTLALAEALEVEYSEAERYKHQEAYVALDAPAAEPTAARASDALQEALRPLIKGLRATLRAHFTERRAPVQRIYLTGGCSRLTNLGRHLQMELGLSVEPLPMASDALAGLSGSGKTLVMGQALALALRDALPPGQVSEINFRQGPFAHKRSRGWFRERLPGMIFMAACLLMAVLALFASRYYAIQKQLEASTKALELATGQLFDEPTSNVETIKKKLSGSDSGPGIIPRYSAYDYFYEVQSRLPTGLKVDLYRLDVDVYRQLIKVEGNTESAASVDQIVEGLETFKCFTGQIQKGNVDAVGEEVRFSLNIAPDCGGDKDKKTK